MEKTQNTARTLAFGNFILNISLGMSLKMLWGMINTLQFIVFFTDWNAQMPSNASIALQTFRSIALGEFIPSEWLTDRVKDVMLEEGQSVESNVLSSMGVMLIILLALLLVILPAVAIVKCGKPGSKLHSIFMALKKKLLWNSLIRFLLQSYLKTILGTLIALTVISFATEK